MDAPLTTFILLPGMDGTGELFADFVVALGADVTTKIVAYPPDQILGYSELEALVRLNLPDDRPYVLVAESFSGPIGIRIAAAAPPNLQALVLVCTFAQSPVPTNSVLRWPLARMPFWHVPNLMSSLFLLGSFWSQSLARTMAAAQNRVSGVVWRARVNSVLDINVFGHLRKVRVPVLCLHAKRDWLVPKFARDLVSTGLTTAVVIDIDGPHFLLQTKPREAAMAVHHFLARLDGKLQCALNRN